MHNQLTRKTTTYQRPTTAISACALLCFSLHGVMSSTALAAKSYDTKHAQQYHLTLTPAPKIVSEDKNTFFKVIGFAQVDAVFQDDDTTNHPNGTTIPRARIGFAGKFYDNWGYKFLYDFGNKNNDELKDIFITYNGFKPTKLKVGQFKEPFGLEWQTTSKYWTFTDLPLTNALTPRRAIGLGGTYNTDQVHLNVAIFGEDTKKVRSSNEAHSVDLHFAYMPVHSHDTHVHVGTSLSYRKPEQATNSFSFSARHETSVTTVSTLSTGDITGVDYNLLTGFEALGIYGPLSAQAEYVRTNLHRDNDMATLHFNSYYGQVSWMITGESKQFNHKKHKYMGIHPKHPLTFHCSGYGAWELAARYEYLDLTDEDVVAGDMKRYGAALSWYANDHIRFSANYYHIDSDRSAAVPNDNSNAVVLRAQVNL